MGLLASLFFLRGTSAWGMEWLGNFVERVGRIRLNLKLGQAPDLHTNVLTVIEWLEWLAVATFVVQFVATGLLLKLAWEMHWYMVTDKSIRIRWGLLRLREQTLTVANIQNLKVKQGPVQRLFGIADLEVQTAGGGDAQTDEDEQRAHAYHIGRFRGLEDVEALRNRLLELQAEQRAFPDKEVIEGRECADRIDAVAAVLTEAKLLRRTLANYLKAPADTG